ncbi:PPC domain-containing protein [Pseudoalteromonas denitrificans]|uniref:Pre-peptidase C-terminal domain-containing protein n=1 Tax=Pseudoalteromonas denitrificans DSM 6059 TaxID=1123010 RepID=A0A1I1E2W6_9GAMM|nr:PPC domain-containing protein [Pseudoalteromonas denitrificans]SFB79173.1 pre-peptidase C-terminal domain-containing protein [Pseudoalteromonas denitrificans DSM 6059]
MKYIFRLSYILFISIISFITHAGEITLSNKNYWEINFSVKAQENNFDQAVNRFNLLTAGVAGNTEILYEIYDGQTLLSSKEYSGPAWHSQDIPGVTTSGINFSQFRNGTIDGKIRVYVTNRDDPSKDVLFNDFLSYTLDICEGENFESCRYADSSYIEFGVTNVINRTVKDSINTTLRNGKVQSNLNTDNTEGKVFTFEVPTGAAGINFALSGGSGDADLFITFGKDKKENDYDCISMGPANEESCKPTESGGTYYIQVKKYSDFKDVSLTASYERIIQSKFVLNDTNYLEVLFSIVVPDGNFNQAINQLSLYSLDGFREGGAYSEVFEIYNGETLLSKNNIGELFADDVTYEVPSYAKTMNFSSIRNGTIEGKIRIYGNYVKDTSKDFLHSGNLSFNLSVCSDMFNCQSAENYKVKFTTSKLVKVVK